MCLADHHIFQVLTKRSQRMMQWTKEYVVKGRLPEHIWMGVSVENQDYVWRIEELQKVPAKVRFLSIEPLLGPVHFRAKDLRGIHWVIVGGESGPKARPMDPQWPRDIRDQCSKCDVDFFFKQWGAFNEEGERVGKKEAGRTLDGKTWDAMPATVC